MRFSCDAILANVGITKPFFFFKVTAASVIETKNNERLSFQRICGVASVGKWNTQKSDEELTLETPASEYFWGHNVTLVNLFE